MSAGPMDRPHAEAIARYAAQESSPVRAGPYAGRWLEPCAGSVRGAPFPTRYSRTGEGMLGVVGPLRRALHAAAGVPLGRCVPVEAQVAFFLREFPARYPECARRFYDHGDLDAVSRCWGKGRSR